MRGWIRYGVVGAAGIVACGFAPKLTGGDGGAPIDAVPAADAGPCQTLGPTCASDDVLRTCAVVDEQPTDELCAWGCVSSETLAHCGALVPSGGAATAADLGSDAQLSEITLDITGTIDTEDGTFGNARSTNDKANAYANGVYWQLRGNVAVFKVKKLVISASLNVQGSHAIAIIATDSITISGALDLTAQCAPNNAGVLGGPGGFTGAQAGSDATGSGAAKGGANDPTLAGGGGGYGAAGGSGGAVTAANGVAGGPAFGDATITVLVGGGAGGGGGNGNSVPKGGGGGGAIQLVTNGALTITGGGAINASGCGGANGDVPNSGGGGGAGGTILLEAHDLAIQGPLAVNGGAGGPGGGGGDGDDGSASRSPAPGGIGGEAGAVGGIGAAGAMLGGRMGMAGATRAGGGGGGIGRMRFNSRTGQATVDNTKLSPALDDPGTTTTQGRPHVQ